MYSEMEVKEIQDAFTGKRNLSEAEYISLKTKLEGKNVPRFLHPFIGLHETNPDSPRDLLPLPVAAVVLSPGLELTEVSKDIQGLSCPPCRKL